MADLFDWADEAPPPRDPGGRLEAAFWQFHSDNPHVYDLLVRFARQWASLHDHCSINLLFERVRWEVMTDVTTVDGFKLNNNHRAFYARLIEDQEADLTGIFRMRQQRVQCTFGPVNEALPPGGHVA